MGEGATPEARDFIGQLLAHCLHLNALIPHHRLGSTPVCSAAPCRRKLQSLAFLVPIEYPKPRGDRPVVCKGHINQSHLLAGDGCLLAFRRTPTPSMTSPTLIQPGTGSGTGSTQHASPTGNTPRATSPPGSLADLPNRYRKSMNPPTEIKREGGKEQQPMRKTSVTRPDENSEWAQKNILALDGGGIRGYSSLLILNQLMREIAQMELQENPNFKSSEDSPLALVEEGNPQTRANLIDEDIGFVAAKCKPCHYFDFIAGTSTGGLIALMLGRLRYSVDECIRKYQLLGESIFGKPLRPRTALQLKRAKSWPQPDPKYKATVQDIFDSPGGAFEDPREFASDPQRCRIIVLSLQMKNGSGTPYIFRSYNLPHKGIDPLSRNPGEGSEFSVCDVAHAASAAPYHFRPSKRRNSRGASEPTDEVFTDGSFWVNNPSWEVLNEVMTMTDRSEKAIGLFLSLGTGETKNPKQDSFWKSLWPSEKSLLKALGSQSNEVHQEFVRNSGLSEYRRFSVEYGLEKVALDEWRPRKDGSQTLNRIREATHGYLHQEKVVRKLRDCARTLVDRRKARAKTSRWEEFALDIRYKCNLPGCSRPDETFEKRSEMMRHLRKEHNMLPPDMNKFEEMQRILDTSRVRKFEPKDAITES